MSKEECKMTEIDALPEEWEVVTLGDISELIIDRKYKEPQINADERIYNHVAGFTGFPICRGSLVTESIEIAHRKGRKERKAAQQESLCPLCSPWLIAFSAPAHGRAAPQPALHLWTSRARG